MHYKTNRIRETLRQTHTVISLTAMHYLAPSIKPMGAILRRGKKHDAKVSVNGRHIIALFQVNGSDQ